MRLVFALVLITGAVSLAADLKPGQEEAKVVFAKEIATNLQQLNEACGTSFTTVQSDFEHYDKAQFTSMHPGQVCQAMLSGAKSVCSQPAYKKAFAAKVKALACVFEGVKKDIPTDRDRSREKANLSLESNGTFTYRLDTAHAGAAIAAQQVLQAALDK